MDGVQPSFDLPGLEGPPALDTLVEKITWVLQENSEGARDRYREVVFQVWLGWYGLANAVAGGLESFHDWMIDDRIPTAKTIQNRTMEIQKANPELRPSPSVQAERQAQSRQGRVGGKGRRR